MGIKTVHMPLSDIYQQPQPWKDGVLGVICFAESILDSNILEEVGAPIAQLQAAILAGTDLSSEIWLSNLALTSASPLQSGYHGAIRYRCNEEFLFGVIYLPEFESLQHTTQSAYRQIFTLMDDLHYPYICRFWNYMADINGISNNLERYRQFNVGRKDAFLECDVQIGKQMPAACALGLADGPLTIAFLLGRQAPVAIENPRQVNAYEYPEAYGPRTPSFSRATLLATEKNEILFISGTASIVGHQTMHPLDVVAQTRETLVNLEVVIAETNCSLGVRKFDLHNICFRVYIRYASDLTLVQDEMERYLGGAINAVFIQADICRRELLLEIEATAGDMLQLTSGT